MTVIHEIAPWRLAFHCPGCGRAHQVLVAPAGPPTWDWNRSLDAPTFSPSILVQGGSRQIRCHSFVRDGRIEYLADCTHELAGRTVDLPAWDDPEGG